MKNLITDRHKRFFEKEVRRYLAAFGLTEYQVFVKFDKLDGFYANSRTNPMGGNSTITLNTAWDNTMRPPSDIELSDTARHECCHVLCARLNDAALNRFVTKEEIDQAEEALVRRLEKLIQL